MRNLKEWGAGALIAGVLASGSPAAQASDVLRCGSRLVRAEALADDVRSVCGEPDYIDRWDSPGAQLVGPLSGTEEWYYNFGPAQLLRIVQLHRGRVTEIQSDGYGFGVDRDHRCSPYDVVEGMSKYRLVDACGEPETKRAEYVLRQLGGSRDVQLRHGLSYVFSEEWTYNFGASNLMRVVTLENGRVADVRTEGRGHGAP